MQCGYLLFIFSQFLLYNFQVLHAENTYLYEYSLNISTLSNTSNLLSNLSGKVQLTRIEIPNVENNSALATKELWHVVLTFDDEHVAKISKMDAITVHGDDGLIEQVFIHHKTSKLLVSQLNLLKGLLSLLNIHQETAAGKEIDSSGICYVTYTMAKEKVKVDGVDLIIIDKQKSACQRLQDPIDSWYHNPLKTIKINENRQIYTRYLFTRTGKIVSIINHEIQEISLFPGLNSIELHGFSVVSWQTLKFIKELSNVNENFQSKLAEWIKLHQVELNLIPELFYGPDYRSIHLGIIYSVDDFSSCSLNSNLFTTRSEQGDEPIILQNLRYQIEFTRDLLQPDKLGTIESARILLGLIRLLRCLPDTPDAVLLLSSATMMAPPAIEAELIYRQANTWRDQLVDVLVSCGTPTCLTVLLNRTRALTHLIATHMQINKNRPSADILVATKMLFEKLWPSLSHISRPTQTIWENLFEFCESVKNSSYSYHTCLITLANLWPRLNEKNDHLNRQFMRLIQKQLDVTGDEFQIPQTLSREFLNQIRERLFVGLTMASQINSRSLTRSLLRIVRGPKFIPLTIRSLAIRIIVRLHFMKNFSQSDPNLHSQFAEIRSLLTEILLQNPDRPEDDLLIGIEAFRGLLHAELESTHLALLLREIARQKRWLLVQTARTLIKQWCDNELLSFFDCACLGEVRSSEPIRCSDDYSLGLAGGWSGLAGTSSLKSGQLVILSGDLLNFKNVFAADYVYERVIGSASQLRSSELTVSVLNREGESKLLQFSMYAEKLETLGGSFNDEETQLGDAWLNLELNYLGVYLLPLELFSGGLADVFSLVLSAPSQPTPILQALRLFADQRAQLSFSCGWILQIDHLGGISLKLSGAVEASAWSSSGRSLLRSQACFVSELQTHINTYDKKFYTSLFEGIGTELSFDFVTTVKLFQLPEGICMGMHLGKDAKVIKWRAFDLSKSNQFKITGKIDHSNNFVIVNNYTIQPVSYALGQENSNKCNKMKVTTKW